MRNRALASGNTHPPPRNETKASFILKNNTVKLQCLVRGYCVGLQAHRALDDCIALRAVVQGIAESYGVRALDLLRDMVVSLDAPASAAQVSTL